MLRHRDEWPPEFESAGSLAAVTVSRAARSLALPPEGRPARPGAPRAGPSAADRDRHGRLAISARHLLASDNSTGGNKVRVTMTP